MPKDAVRPSETFHRDSDMGLDLYVFKVVPMGPSVRTPGAHIKVRWENLGLLEHVQTMQLNHTHARYVYALIL